MQARLHTFFRQKIGNQSDEYEDYFEPKGPSFIDKKSVIMAIADGATDSIFSKEWARLIVENFVKRPFFHRRSLQRTSERISQVWRNNIKEKPLPWYAEEKLKSGAFSTLLGVVLLPQGKFRAISLGDCCLFQIRDNELHLHFPPLEPEDFGSTPYLLSTNPNYNERIWPFVMTCNGDWKKGDIFFLMTDALSQWFVKENKNNKKPWDVLLDFILAEENQQFDEWIVTQHQSKLIRNDDMTLLILEVFNNAPASR
jgi:hypothetical protein